jgi:hypothetical protein
MKARFQIIDPSIYLVTSLWYRTRSRLRPEGGSTNSNSLSGTYQEPTPIIGFHWTDPVCFNVAHAVP